jgi:hypothetical protein
MRIEAASVDERKVRALRESIARHGGIVNDMTDATLREVLADVLSPQNDRGGPCTGTVDECRVCEGIDCPDD